MVVSTKKSLFSLLCLTGMFIASLFFTSCKTNAPVIYDRHDSLIVYHDTIISIQERVDTFYIPSTIIVHDTIIKNGKKSELKIYIKDNKGVQIICKENEYKLKLDSVIKLQRINHFRSETKIIYECKEDWHKFLQYFFYLAIAMLIIYMLIKK